LCKSLFVKKTDLVHIVIIRFDIVSVLFNTHGCLKEKKKEVIMAITTTSSSNNNKKREKHFLRNKPHMQIIMLRINVFLLITLFQLYHQFLKLIERFQ